MKASPQAAGSQAVGIRTAGAVTGSRAPLGWLILGSLAAVAVLLLVVLPPIAQDPGYHQFHDQREMNSIPHALNVISNIPFILIGLFGLVRVAEATDRTVPFELRPAYLILFAGVLLTGFGSAYYHWAPDNHTLVWDRLPMTLAFMGLFAAVLGERLDPKLGRRATLPLLACGIGSVLWWVAFDDLRPYGVVQFLPILLILVLMWAFPARYTQSNRLIAALGWYLVAKLLEEADGLVFALGGVISGHTLKHLAAAAGAWCLYRMLASRQWLPEEPGACRRGWLTPTSSGPLEATGSGQ